MDENQRQTSSESGKKTSILTPILIILAIFYVGFLLYQAVYMNYATNQKIDKLTADLKAAQTDKDRLGLLINYYKTSTFQELEARKKLGLKMPGEKVVNVTVPESTPQDLLSKEQSSEVLIKQNNSQYWIDFLAGRDQN